MQCNQAGIDLIKRFEGCRLTAYDDYGGVLTIGYGQTGPFVQMGMTITQAQADMWLLQQIQYVSVQLSRLIIVPVSFNQFAALVCFAYNVGVGNFRGSTLLKLLDRSWYEQVPAQLMRWDKVNGEEVQGLTYRRQAECDLWNTSDNNADVT